MVFEKNHMNTLISSRSIEQEGVGVIIRFALSLDKGHG